jgi:hypothetical protein
VKTEAILVTEEGQLLNCGCLPASLFLGVD